MTDDRITAALTEAIATACRVMAAGGLVEHVLGHISARAGDHHLLVRCRGPREAGLSRTRPEDIKLVPIQGPAGDLDGWTPPNELPIHTGVLRRRPEVTAVAHAHPPAVVTHSLLDEPLLPVYGAYDIPGARMAAGGIPVWSRSALVTTDELAGAMAEAMGDRPVVVLRGHGVVSAAGGDDPVAAVRTAVLQAFALDTLARVTLAVRQAGGTPRAIGDDDLAGLPDLGGGFNVETMWRHLLTRLPAAD
ncbi:class II aldolase/adducin family protein [Actinoplanes sp. NPDC051513]|uniref:class II aldolase/adducin family protein n=1 Tax=Actinoplanes sp. NPDC051513 TaxID=3363908 RepID=UPI0037AC05E7